MKRNIILVLILFFCSGKSLTEINMKNYRFPVRFGQIYQNLQKQFNSKALAKYIIVDTSTQEMYLLQQKKILKVYSISTSKFGIGNKNGSFKTPKGYHRIVEKIGNDVPIGGIFKKKIFTGKTATIYTSKRDVTTDYITTRIMVINGLEPGLNSGKGIDSKMRGIFIHGTQEEGLIGEPASNGCIRMKNMDIVDLFDIIDNGTFISII